MIVTGTQIHGLSEVIARVDSNSEYTIEEGDNKEIHIRSTAVLASRYYAVGRDGRIREIKIIKQPSGRTPAEEEIERIKMTHMHWL